MYSLTVDWVVGSVCVLSHCRLGGGFCVCSLTVDWVVGSVCVQSHCRLGGGFCVCTVSL